MNVRHIVIWANCQSAAIEHSIAKHHAEKFKTTLFSNYKFIRDKLPISADDIALLASADIFLYQNQSYNVPPHDLATIQGYLKADCVRVSFPTLHSCNLIFGYETHEPKNQPTIGRAFPFGKFYYGVPFLAARVSEARGRGATLEEALSEVLAEMSCPDLISADEIDRWKSRTFEFLEAKCKISDIPEIFDFIAANYQRHRLWHNPNHPTGLLLNEMNRLLFAKIGLEYPASADDIAGLEEVLSDWVVPIFDCVKARLGLTFPTAKCSSWYWPEISDAESYLRTYIRELYA